MRSKLKLLIFTVMMSGLLFACASVPPASSNIEKKALSFTTLSGLASVYVYRPYSFAAAASLFKISLDYKEFGNLATNTYLFSNIKPGSHIIRVEFTAISHVTPIKFETEAGKCYFF